MQTALRTVLFILCFLVCQFSFATEYIFSGNGSWTNLANWKDGLYPGVAIKSGDIVNITGQAVMGICPTYPMPTCEDVYGRNLGTINIAVGGSLTLQNQNQYSSGGVLNIYGTLINKTQFEGWETQTIHVWGTIDNRWGMGNDGTITIYEGGTLKSSGLFSNHEIGKLILKSGGTISNEPSGRMTLGTITNEGGSIRNVAKLQGDANINGSLLNYGILAPGNSPGKYSISGDYTATSSTIHQFEVGGISDGQYDQLKVDGAVNLNGTLDVTLIDGFSLIADHEIPIITGTVKGTFSNVNIPYRYTLVYNSNNVVLKSISIQKVSFTALNIVKESSKGKLSWTVSNETDAISYEIQRSSSGNDYTTIGTVNATAAGSYSFIDESPGASAYYQVKVNYRFGLSSRSSAVHIYYVVTTNTFTGTGNWTDATKWSSGTVPNFLFGGMVLVINGNCTYDLMYDLMNYGQIDILQNSTLTIGKTPFTTAGTMNINGTLENNSDRFENLGTINLSGTYINNTIYFNGAPNLKLLNKSTFINNSTGDFWSGSIEMADDANFVNHGRVKGTVTFKGNFVNEANLSPGNSPGSCTVQGNYTATLYARHNFEVEGITSGTYDVLHVTGIVNLGGAMNITVKPGVTISGSTEIPIITGAINGKFASTSLPDGLMLDYKANSVVLKAVTPLPVHFVNLEGRKQADGVQLTWKVAEEKDVLRYEVEKSTDGNQFSKMGIVEADLKEVYSFIDHMPSPIAYYRVKSVDLDGKHAYSQTIYLKGEANTVVLKAFFAGSGNQLVVQHPIAVNGSKIYIHSIDGQLMKVVLAQNGGQLSTIDFPFHQSCIYIISYGKDKGIWESTKVFLP